MGKYTLEELYNQVTEAIKSLDFEQIWEGFKPLKFALYDEAPECPCLAMTNINTP